MTRFGRSSLRARLLLTKSVHHLARLPFVVRSTLERAAQRRALEEAESRYRSLFRRVPVGLLRTTPAGEVLDANPALLEMFGASDQASLPRLKSTDLYARSEDRQRWQALIEREGVVRDFEMQARRLDGSLIWIRANIRAVRDEAGRILYYDSALEDISERKRTAEAAAALAEVGRALSHTLDADVIGQRIADTVRGLLRVQGSVLYRLEPASGDLVAVAVSGDVGPTMAPGTVLAQGTGLAGLAARERQPTVSDNVLTDPRVAFTAEARGRLELATFRVALCVPLLLQEEVIGVLGVGDRPGRAFDAAEIRLLEAFADQATLSLGNARLYQQVRSARDFLQSIVENSADAILTTDVHGRITLSSPAVEDIFGYGAADVLGRPVAEYYRGGREEARAVMRRLRADGRIRNYETAFRAADGRWVEMSGSFSLLRDAGGAVIGTLGVIKDVTERKRAEEALRESEDRFRSAFENAAIGMALQGLDGRYLRVNRALGEMLGYPEPELLALTYRAVTYPDDAGIDVGYDRRLLAGETPSYQVEKRYVHKTGRVVWVLASISLVRAGDGTPLYFIAQVQDISERKRAEEEIHLQREALIQREKVAAMGQLLAGVAHELNNPLSVVMGHTALLAKDVRGQPAAKRAEKIAVAAERCARIVKNFLAMARQRPSERERLALNDSVRSALELLVYPLRVDNVDIQLDLADDLPPLWADAHQLQQVLVNLVTNAHQAMRETARPRRLTIATGADPTRSRVRLEVADTGPGIPPAIQGRIFEPFFTTKPPGQGTGLGLSLCHGICEGHQGTIRVESEPGRGARFVVELPVEAPARVEPPAPAAVPGLGGRQILVVDDEPEVGELLVELLAADSHHVETVGDGARALDVLARRPYDVILSDMKMPRLDGPGLYRELERRRPELCARVIFITGDVLSPDTQRFLEATGAPTLGKPFTLEEVRRVLQRVLQSPRP